MPSVLAAAALVSALAGAAVAQGCRPVLVDALQFCPGGTSWQGVPLTPELSGNTVKALTGFGPEAVLVFSRIPEEAVAKLPRRPRHRHVVQALDEFSELTVTYLDYAELDRFSPLGEDVAVSSMAMHDVKAGWINVFTYIAEGDARLVVQTGVRGATALTDRHRDLHIEAVRAVREASQ